MLDTTGYHQHLPFLDLDRSITELHGERTLEYQEEFIALGVGVPGEVAEELGELDLLAVGLSDDPGRPVVAKVIECLGEVDGLHTGSVDHQAAPGTWTPGFQ